MSPQTLLLERRQRGLTQGELGARIGVSPQLISMLERGRRPIRPDRAVQIVKALHAPSPDAAAPRSS